MIHDQVLAVERQIADLQRQLKRLRTYAKMQRLSPMEARIAARLVSGVYVSSTSLTAELETSAESIRVLVGRIRRKLNGVEIETVCGQGYRVVAGLDVLRQAIEIREAA